MFNPKGKKSNRKLKHADVEKARRSKITVGTDDLWMIIEAEWRDKFSEVYHKRINDVRKCSLVRPSCLLAYKS